MTMTSMILKPYTENGRATTNQRARMTACGRVACSFSHKRNYSKHGVGRTCLLSQPLSEKLAFLIKCLSNLLWTLMGLRFALGNQLPTCPITHTLSCQLPIKGLVTFNQTFFSLSALTMMNWILSYQMALPKGNLGSGLPGSISLLCIIIIKLWYMLRAKLSESFL